MKIIYLSGSSFPSVVTHTLSKARMCQAFADQGHQVLLSAAAGQGDKDVHGYYGLRGGFGLTLKELSGHFNRRVRECLLAFHHRKAVRYFRPDVIYSRLTLAELLLIPCDVRIVYEMHSLGPLGRSTVKEMLFRLLLRIKYFRRIIVTTDALAAMIRERVPGIEVVVARLSAEPPEQIHAQTKSIFRFEHLQGPDFAQHVGYTGNLDTVGLRGTEVICQTAAQLPRVAFHVVGGDATTVDFWRKYSKQYNIHQNIFFYGHRNPAEMPLFLTCFDVVMAPLQWKPSRSAPIGAGMSPLKLSQYMAYHKAIVASDIPAHQEMLEHGKTALLVPCDNITAWVRAIKVLLNDPQLREQLGEACFSAYERNFTPEGRVRTILQGLDESTNG